MARAGGVFEESVSSTTLVPNPYIKDITMTWLDYGGTARILRTSAMTTAQEAESGARIACSGAIATKARPNR